MPFRDDSEQRDDRPAPAVVDEDQDQDQGQETKSSLLLSLIRQLIIGASQDEPEGEEGDEEEDEEGKPESGIPESSPQSKEQQQQPKEQQQQKDEKQSSSRVESQFHLNDMNLEPNSKQLQVKSEFPSLLAQWCGQAALGTIINLYKTIVKIAETSVKYKMAQEHLTSSHGELMAMFWLEHYLDMCWKDLHTGEDKIVVKQYEDMKRAGQCLHNSCLHEWISTISERGVRFLLTRLKIAHLRDQVDWTCQESIRGILQQAQVDWIADMTTNIPTITGCTPDCKVIQFKAGEVSALQRRLIERPQCQCKCLMWALSDMLIDRKNRPQQGA